MFEQILETGSSRPLKGRSLGGGGLHIYIYMGGCQNYGPFLGTLNIRCRIRTGAQKGIIILTTAHMCIYIYRVKKRRYGSFPNRIPTESLDP